MKADADRGSAAVWVLTLTMVLWSSMTAAVLVGVAVAARHRAATAADLAALAGAAAEARAELSGGPAVSGGAAKAGGAASVSGCVAAEAIAVANDATVVACRVLGSVVEVTAAVRVPGLTHLALGSVSAKARAGPS